MVTNWYSIRVIPYLLMVLSLSLLYTCVTQLPINQSNKSDIPILNISKQLLAKDDIFGGRFPEYTVNGEWLFRPNVNWLTGFITGEHWILFDLTGYERHKERALAWTDQLKQFTNIDYTHDMGLIFLPSVYESWQRTGDERYLKALGEAAEMLAKRYNPNGNFIRAWGKLGGDENNAGWMIIDSMMNIELLFIAAELFNKTEWYRIAYAHAVTTFEQSFRDDMSTYHIIEFDPNTGDILKKRTHQGLEDETTWARGQAWAIYGFASAFTYTGDLRFRDAAVQASEYFVNHLHPERGDFVPNWDLSIHQEGFDQKDASAAAVAANGIYLLADITEDPKIHQSSIILANAIVEDLLNEYLFTASERKTEQGILLHTTYNHPKGRGVNESFPPGDYYFLAALKHYVGLQDHSG